MTSYRACVTGAGGFVGANLVRRLVADGHEVMAIVRPGSDDWRLSDLGRDIAIVACDLTDSTATRRLVMNLKPDRIFHLAAHGAYSWETDRARMLSVNVETTVSLLTVAEQCDVEAFVHAGSSSEYGFKDHAPTEDESLEPNSDYAATKAAATLLVGHVGRAGALRTSTLRLYSAYGPWEDPGRLIPTLVAHGLRRELPPLVDPRVARDFVYVDDVCDAFLLASDRAEAGAVYNVGTGVQTTVRDVVDIATRVLDIRAAPEWGTMEEREWDSHVWVADARRIASELGWRPNVALEDGFSRVVSWMKEQRNLWSRYGVGVRSEPSQIAPPL